MPDKRSPRGMPAIRESNGRLQVHVTFKGKRHCISLGLPDTEGNRNAAERLKREIEEDLERFRFDVTLERYYSEFSTIDRRLKEKPRPKKIYLSSLGDVWDKYESFKEGQVEETTMNIYYANVRSHISRLPTLALDEPCTIRDFLLKNCSANAAKKTLEAIATACRWALQSDLIEVNTFQGISSTIRLKQKKDEDSIDPFERSEVREILKAFEEHKYHWRYYNYVSFLFNTGCRTSEAVGLKWEHIDKDFKSICFQEALVQTPKGHVLKGLKSQERRHFKCNEVVKAILSSQQNTARNEYVFPGKNTKHIVRNNFTAQVWKGSKSKSGIVQELVERGLIDHYRPQYNTRHTFITLALEEGLHVKDVARLVGNTPKIIYEHYAGRNRDLEIPPLF